MFLSVYRPNPGGPPRPPGGKPGGGAPPKGGGPPKPPGGPPGGKPAASILAKMFYSLPVYTYVGHQEVRLVLQILQVGQSRLVLLGSLLGGRIQGQVLQHQEPVQSSR